MKVILSIKPQFAEKIFEGTKKFEFRRSIFKNQDVKKVVVYASAPISKIIGEFDIEDILHDDLGTLWEETMEFSGISEEYYFSYFEGKNLGFALKIKSIKKYDNHYCIKETFGISPPQSFAYIKEENTYLRLCV
jgi:predicted transcriptional regulator